MIWASAPTGSVSYVGPEWTVFTGQPTAEAIGSGWLKMLHEEDRDGTQAMFLEACSARVAFTIQYRLLRATGSYARVVAGASPSTSPVDGRFLGYLGSAVEVLELIEHSRFGLGKLFIPPPVLSTMPLTALDVIADHVLMARATAQQAGETSLYACLDLAVSIIQAQAGGSSQEH